MKIYKNTVINFHAIHDYKWMDNIFSLLKRTYQIVSLSELESFYYEEGSLKNACHITFDDGDISFYNIVYPLIKKHNLPVSIYVSPKVAKEQTNFWFQEIRDYDRNKLKAIIKRNKVFNVLDAEDKPMNAILKSLPLNLILTLIDQYRHETNTPVKPPINMTVSQLKELDASGFVKIGAHTLNHPILKNESDETCETEIKNSIEELSDILEKDIISFAYPNGTPGLDFAQREIQILKQSKTKLAFSTDNSAICEEDNPLSIPRNGISYGSNSFVLCKLLLGKRWKYFKRKMKGKSEEEYREDIINLMINYKTTEATKHF